MKKQTKKTLWRGLTSTSAVLMVVSLFGTQCAITYTGTLNSYLGTTTSRIVSTGDPSAEDTNYYTSEFGDYSAENLQKLIQATYDESVLEQEEGSVLLRNNNSALPLSSNSHVTLFGHAVVQPVYAPGGANSGAASTGTYVIDLYQALKDVGFSINDTLYDAYKNSSTSRVASNNLTISGGPNSTGDFNAAPVLGEEPKSFYTAQLQQSWENDYNDVAIVMLAREGGEDCEMMMEDPDGISALALHQDEKDMLAMIRDSGKFSKIVVLLNSAYPMELGWMDEYNVDACLWIGDPGQRGFEGVANLLTGKENPSGHLTDTYAANSLSSPAAYTQSQNVAEWSNVDEVLNSGIVTDSPLHVSYTATQAEGIYVGYKYYETRYEDSILNPASGASGTTGSSFGGGWNYAAEVTYPFGYGLSYTTFEQTLNSVSYDADQDMFTATVTVKNTGSVSGKSVVQLYVQTPYGDYEKQNAVEKSAVQVIGYGKTDELKPGQSEQVTVTMDRYMMASYDYTNAKGYILSAGDYYLALGDNAHDALNNILAAKGASGMVDQDGNTVEGNAAKTYRWNYDTLDTESYRYSVTGEEVTNQFDDCNANYWQEGSVTYLTRQDWNGTFPTKAPAITCTEEMMQILQGELYTKPEDSPSVSDITQGQNNGLTFVSMKDVSFDDTETWDKYLDQMTVEAQKALEQSDVIVGYTVYVDLLREHFPEKQFLTTPMRQEVERCRMAFEEAKKGQTVAMVCGGDAGVYGMSGLILELQQEYPECEVEVVSGVTAALAGGAVLGAPLMHDFAVISLSDLLTPWEKIEKRLRAAAAADFVICLYNPSSKKRHDYLQKACDLMMKYKSPDTICGTVSNIARDGEEAHVMTLKELRDTQVDMFTTVFIGNSQTKEINNKMVTPRGYRNV